MRKSLETSSYPMELLAEIICEMIGLGKEVVFTAKGHSMRPLLRSERDQVILTAFDGRELASGEVIFYRRKSGAYVIHRIADRAQDGSYVLVGDSQTVLEYGIQPNQILAVASGFIINGREVSVEDRAYKRYTAFWGRSRRVRRVYIFLLYGGFRLYALAAAVWRRLTKKKR